jgi:leader peptidase (prepilin peptidase)/N-methyltransferase
VRWPEGRTLGGRSACDGCGKALTAWELVPLLSFARQRGRCRACRDFIHPIHPTCELLGLAIGVSAGLVAAGWAAVAGAVFGWLLLALGAVDARAFWLPDRLTLTLAVTGLLVGLADIVPPPLAARLIGGVAGFVALAAVRLGYRWWRRREGLGGGDPKLFGAIGLWLGWEALPIVMLVACGLGLGFALGWRMAGRAVRGDTRLPLGTLLAAGGYATWLLSIR